MIQNGENETTIPEDGLHGEVVDDDGRRRDGWEESVGDCLWEREVGGEEGDEDVGGRPVGHVWREERKRERREREGVSFERRETARERGVGTRRKSYLRFHMDI